MIIAKTSKKVFPCELLPKQNKFVKNDSNIQQLKYLFLFQVYLGISRQYLFCERRYTRLLCSIYNSILILFNIISLIINDIYKTSYIIMKVMAGVEYLMLSFIAIFLQQNKLKSFFSNLKSFDEILNIHNHVTIITPRRWYLIPLGGVLLYHVLDISLYFLLVKKSTNSHSFYFIYLQLMVHDGEIILYAAFLIMILKRLCILKVHAYKIFLINNKEKRNLNQRNEINDLKNLVENVQLDYISYFKVYDLLHKTSEKLTALMRFPITIILITSGLSTILLSQKLIILSSTDNNSGSYHIILRTTTAIVIGRCLMHLLLIMFPCFISNMTKLQASVIRAMIYEYLNTKQFDKLERRQIKALYQLTCNSEFSYKLWDAVRLDMSLPLLFTSLCITYLIISVQFSKFID